MQTQSQQQIQQKHDLRNHFDILAMSRVDRLKHYGLHFAKYAGRLARGSAEPKSELDTVTDAVLVCLSAANALNQPLSKVDLTSSSDISLLRFVDCAGRFADACEKIDHLEEFRTISLTANADIFRWLLAYASEKDIDMEELLASRRQQLASRAVYHAS